MAEERGKLGMIPLAGIKNNPAALRDVNKMSVEYKEIVDSIIQKGVLTPITVRPNPDDDKETFPYMLIDGLHRTSAARDAGLKEIPAHVLNLNDCDVLIAQTMANAVKVETKPAEYAKQIKRILAYEPTWTLNTVAEKLGKSASWVRDRLSLNNLSQKVAELVDNDEIKLTNAYMLARLPAEEQPNFVAQAMTQEPGEFGSIVKGRVKELRDAAKQGRDAGPAEFTPTAYMQKMADIKAEQASLNVVRALIGRSGATTAEQGAQIALNWVLHLDPVSIDAQKKKAEERQKQQNEAKKRREEEVAAKKAERAAKAAAEAQEEAEKLRADVAKLKKTLS